VPAGFAGGFVVGVFAPAARSYTTLTFNVSRFSFGILSGANAGRAGGAPICAFAWVGARPLAARLFVYSCPPASPADSWSAYSRPPFMVQSPHKEARHA
jgi:hypothetical protein